MASHPLNLAVRFILEMTTLFMVGFWCWKQHDGILKFVLAFGLPILLATVWGLFAVSNDPSRSGKTVIETMGAIRLLIEIAFFSMGIIATYKLGYTKISLVFGLTVLVHYLVSYDRVMWLMKQ